MGVCVRACVPSMFCGLGIDVDDASMLVGGFKQRLWFSRGFVLCDFTHAHSKPSDEQEFAVEHSLLVGEVVLVLRRED